VRMGELDPAALLTAVGGLAAVAAGVRQARKSTEEKRRQQVAARGVRQDQARLKETQQALDAQRHALVDARHDVDRERARTARLERDLDAERARTLAARREGDDAASELRRRMAAREEHYQSSHIETLELVALLRASLIDEVARTAAADLDDRIRDEWALPPAPPPRRLTDDANRLEGGATPDPG
jgi:hypothetical protein